jgi:WD40 repeat protein
MVRIWSPTNGKPIAALDGRSSWLDLVAFSAYGRTLAAAGNDNQIRVWDLDGIGDVRANRPR